MYSVFEITLEIVIISDGFSPNCFEKSNSIVFTVKHKKHYLRKRKHLCQNFIPRKVLKRSLKWNFVLLVEKKKNWRHFVFYK